MGMRLADCEIERLLPTFMRQDADALAMARALDPFVRELAAAMERLPDFAALDSLPEEWLDELARELCIDWYDWGADLPAKRLAVRESDKVHAHLGTKAAVERALSGLYGAAIVSEWFEYGGVPGHFRLTVRSHSAKIAEPRKLAGAVGAVKRASAILDGVDFIWEDFLSAYAAAGMAQALVPPPLSMEGSPYDVSMPEYQTAGMAQAWVLPALRSEGELYGLSMTQYGGAGGAIATVAPTLAMELTPTLNMEVGNG